MESRQLANDACTIVHALVDDSDAPEWYECDRHEGIGLLCALIVGAALLPLLSIVLG